jgi:predicted phosphoribosyltransferase
MINFLNVYNQQPFVFRDRTDAGRRLAEELQKYVQDNPIVLALPRGGVPVGYEISKALGIPMDVIVARKIGAPSNPELGIGAISEEDVMILDQPTIRLLGFTDGEIKYITGLEQQELKRRIELYRNNKPLPPLHNRTVILVDDGLATGVTAKAAIKSLLKLRPKKLVYAVPVCAQDTAEAIRHYVDEFICLYSPYELSAIGLYYQDFDQVTDKEVTDILKTTREKFRKN